MAKKNKNKFPGYPHYPANEDIMNTKDNERVDLDVENFSRSRDVSPNIPDKSVRPPEAEDKGPVLADVDDDTQPREDDGIDCEVSNFYSKAYLRHLIKAKEILGLQIASIHNLAFYLDIVTKARENIIAGSFTNWKNEMTILWQQRL